MRVLGADILEPGGPIAQRLRDSFDPRPQQQRMARAVGESMARRSTLLVEAGAGVGKSYAYLVPALERVVHHGERVVVATHTIALQEQVLSRDVPTLREALEPLGVTFRAALVKGRGNYLSIRRLQLASARQDKLLTDAASKRALHQIEDWAYETADGTLSTLPQLERPAVWERVQSDAANCMGRKCPTYDKCFFQSARREMDRAQLLICNHALFFADLALRSRGVGFLPDYDHVVLDEAHAVEDVASEYFGRSLSETRIRRLLSTLMHERGDRGFLASLALTMGDKAADAARLVHEADQAARLFFDRLLALQPGPARSYPGQTDSGAPAASYRIAEPDALENTLSPAFSDLAVRLRRLRDATDKDEDRLELNAYAERAAAIADDAEALVTQEDDGSVYWAEATRAAHGVRASLSSAPIDLAPVLREHLFGAGTSVILTSATLATGGSGGFDLPKSRLGCEDAETLALGSPYDFARLVRVYVDSSMPDPRDGAYFDRLTAAIVRHAGETRGGAFVLFTSFDTLQKAARLAAPRLEDAGLSVLTQTRDVSRTALLEAFRESGSAVLFGAASFWQGVDVRGGALRNVIITRLPFEPPERPLTQARLDRIAEEGGDPFFEDSLPRAVLRFKQGFGRLVRSSTDTGRVVILDSRIATKGYGRSFLRAIPEGVPIEDTATNRVVCL